MWGEENWMDLMEALSGIKKIFVLKLLLKIDWLENGINEGSARKRNRDEGEWDEMMNTWMNLMNASYNSLSVHHILRRMNQSIDDVIIKSNWMNERMKGEKAGTELGNRLFSFSSFPLHPLSLSSYSFSRHPIPPPLILTSQLWGPCF